MPRLVPQDATALGFAGALAFQHLCALEAHQPGVPKVKRHGKSQGFVRGKKLLRQPDVRLCNNLAGGKFMVQPGDTTRHQGVVEAHREVAQPETEQGFVGGVLQVNWRISPPTTAASTHGALIPVERGGGLNFLVHALPAEVTTT